MNTQTHNCVCLPNEMDERQQRAIQYCFNSTHFFVYRDYNGTVSTSSDPGNCTTICCGNCNTITANGNNLEGRSCSSKNDTLVGRCGTIQKSASTVFKWGLNYYDSLNYCMTRNALLPSSNYCQKIGKKSDFKGQLSWTNVFRQEIEILQMKDFEGQPQRCFSGIFIQVEGNKILNITEQQCSGNKKYYVCKTTIQTGIHIDTEVKTQRPLFTHNKGMTEDVRTSPDLLSSHEKEKSSYQSTASMYSTETVLHNGQREKGNNSILTGAVIGGIISACSILVVIAALIACKIRSNGILKESNTFEKGETSQLHFSNTINQDSTNTRKRKVNDLCETSASEYSVVNNLVFLEKMNATFTDATDGEYDVLHDKQNRTMCMTENMYHSHGVHQNEVGPTYDSAAIVKGNHNDINGLYDTSFSVVEGDYSYMSYKSHDHSMTTDIYDKSTL
ncbi:uncharacterized protein LOC143054233 isoform X1 [Mytilus galloprovincialis]|uniref:uncharacterized protein LOC143054233 isoform X1 n=1 Tax=Mytilus galloprovincialis TaxID=29158 RepID=UPI003F7B445A